MKPGNSKNKGSTWEREVGKLLSLWLTHNERGDIFARNVLSGGTFTLAMAKGHTSSHNPGDLIAAHPLAFRFLECFAVECKHLADIGLDAYLLDPRGQCNLGRIISLAKGQAKHINREYMVVAKQNHRDALMLVSGDSGNRILQSLKMRGDRPMLAPMYHRLHRGSVVAMRFIDMLRTVDPDKLLGE